MAPASNQYILGRPFVRRAVLDLPNGKRFTVVADGLDDAHVYVGSVSLDGKPLHRAFITHQELMAGGELRFTMQARPNLDWPGAGAQAPYSMSNE